MQDIAFELLPQIISAEPGQFEEKWADFVKRHEEVDIEVFEKHMTEGIQKRIEEWSK
jgi:hypothetical protein